MSQPGILGHPRAGKQWMSRSPFLLRWCFACVCDYSVLGVVFQASEDAVSPGFLVRDEDERDALPENCGSSNPDMLERRLEILKTSEDDRWNQERVWSGGRNEPHVNVLRVLRTVRFQSFISVNKRLLSPSRNVLDAAISER